MMMTKIKIVLSPKQKKEILDALRSFKHFTDISSGIISCNINRDVIHRNIILYLEEWQNREDLERHIQSQKYRNLLEVIEQSSKKPEINFFTVSKIEGLEVVKNVRIKT